MKQLGNLAIVAASHVDCMLQIYDGKATIYIGAGTERKSFSCDAMDDDCINEMIAYLNFGTPIKNINMK